MNEIKCDRTKSVIIDRYKAGESINSLAYDYCVDVRTIGKILQQVFQENDR